MVDQRASRTILICDSCRDTFASEPDEGMRDFMSSARRLGWSMKNVRGGNVRHSMPAVWGLRMNIKHLSPLANIRMAIDVLRNRVPGALAMLKAEDIAIATHSNDKGEQWNTITFYFGHNGRATGDAYRACERLYELNRSQERLPWRATGKPKEATND